MSTRTEAGYASFYDTADGTCAHKTLSMGTIVTVVSLESGRRVTCRVADRGPYIDGRVIDLDRETFAQLTSPSRGLVLVRIEW